MGTRKLKIGLLGCGTVGGGLVELVQRNSSLIRQRAGVELSISKILVRDLLKERPGPVVRDRPPHGRIDRLCWSACCQHRQCDAA